MLKGHDGTRRGRKRGFQVGQGLVFGPAGMRQQRRRAAPGEGGPYVALAVRETLPDPIGGRDAQIRVHGAQSVGLVGEEAGGGTSGGSDGGQKTVPSRNFNSLGFGKGVADVGAAIGKGVGGKGNSVASDPVHVDLNNKEVRRVLRTLPSKYRQIKYKLGQVESYEALLQDPRQKDSADVFRRAMEGELKDLQEEVDALVVQEQNEKLRRAAIVEFAKTGAGNLSYTDQTQGYDLRQMVDFSKAALEANNAKQRGESAGRGGVQTTGGAIADAMQDFAKQNFAALQAGDQNWFVGGVNALVNLGIAGTGDLFRVGTGTGGKLGEKGGFGNLSYNDYLDVIESDVPKGAGLVTLFAGPAASLLARPASGASLIAYEGIGGRAALNSIKAFSQYQGTGSAILDYIVDRQVVNFYKFAGGDGAPAPYSVLGHGGISFGKGEPILGFAPRSAPGSIRALAPGVPGQVRNETALFGQAWLSTDVSVESRLVSRSVFAKAEGQIASDFIDTSKLYVLPKRGACPTYNCLTYPGSLGLPLPRGWDLGRITPP